MLDVHSNDRVVAVEWRAHRGFGISAAAAHAYGEGPDEILASPEDAADRVLALFETGGTTAPPTSVTLSGLREHCRLSQAELAQRLRVSQARVSALEKNPPRSRLTTIRKAIEALGARVEIRAILPNRQAISLDLSDARTRRPRPRSLKAQARPSRKSEKTR